jgi:NTP pyrophosphatase (non-canonical NTP hydrolase)
MTPPTAPATASLGVSNRTSNRSLGELGAVVCGSFRRALDTIRIDIAALADAGCSVLSPTGLDFVAEADGFVFLENEVSSTPAEIERRHLESLRRADLIWLHAPGGYVGASGAFELGVAHMAGAPVYCREAPRDVTLCSFVSVVGSLAEAVAAVREGPQGQAGAPLAALQAYYSRMAVRRGWSHEGLADCMLLLTEEVGELARAVRSTIGLSRQGGTTSLSAAEELADVQLYLVHLANVAGIDLASAVTEKERRNADRALSEAAAA